MCGDGEDIGIEDDVLGWEADFLREEVVGARADADLFVARRGLALLVERHHDRGRAVAADERGAAQKLRLAILE